MRNIATSSGACFCSSSAFETAASRSAMARVTRAARCAGSSVSGSVQIAASRSRVSGPAQVFEINPERLPVGELVVGFPVAAEVGVNLEAMADVADHDEGRRLVRPGSART